MASLDIRKICRFLIDDLCKRILNDFQKMLTNQCIYIVINSFNTPLEELYIMED